MDAIRYLLYQGLSWVQRKNRKSLCFQPRRQGVFNKIVLIFIAAVNNKYVTFALVFRFHINCLGKKKTNGVLK